MTPKKIQLIDDAGGWSVYTGGVYRCQVFLSKQDDGGFLAVVAPLADVTARGATESEALANVTAALVNAIPTRRTSAGVPWTEPPMPQPDALVRWVFADTRAVR